MAATLSATIVDGAPGNVITIAGTGLTAGAGASVTIDSQGVNSPPNLTPTTLTLAAVFNTTSVNVTIPDGIMPGTMTVTASDGTKATCSLRVWSQYVQAAEYIGEGVDLSDLATGELDNILRSASARADSIMCGSIRLLQTLEKHKYRAKTDTPPKMFPWRSRGRRVPLVSCDQLNFVTSNVIRTTFNTSDLYVSSDPVTPELNYIEILAYAIGNYALLGAMEIIGYSANVLELAVTTGWGQKNYPPEVIFATKIIATEILTYRKIQEGGLGGLSRMKAGTQQFDRRNEPYAVPQEARELLRPFIARVMA